MNKEKLINDIKKRKEYLSLKIDISVNSKVINHAKNRISELEFGLEKIENGEFDND